MRPGRPRRRRLRGRQHLVRRRSRLKNYPLNREATAIWYALSPEMAGPGCSLGHGVLHGRRRRGRQQAPGALADRRAVARGRERLEPDDLNDKIKAWRTAARQHAMNITIPTIAADSIALILAPATKADPTDDAYYLRELTVFGLNPKTRHEPSAQAEINLGHLICRDSPLLNEQVKIMQGQVEEHFGRHPDAEIILSQPGMGPILGARVLAEFGDAPGCYADAKARKNYAGTSPITRAFGRKKVVCPVRPQRPPRRRGHITGPIRAAGLARGPRLLRQTKTPWSRPQRRLLGLPRRWTRRRPSSSSRQPRCRFRRSGRTVRASSW